VIFLYVDLQRQYDHNVKRYNGKISI